MRRGGGAGAGAGAGRGGGGVRGPGRRVGGGVAAQGGGGHGGSEGWYSRVRGRGAKDTLQAKRLGGGGCGGGLGSGAKPDGPRTCPGSQEA
jgi:hypothetical protein